MAGARPVVQQDLEDMMRALRILNSAVLATLVATSAALYAQDEKQQEEKPARQEQPRPEPKQQEQPRPEARHEEMKAPRQDEAKPSKQEKQEQKQEQKMEDNRSREMRPAQQEPARPEGHNDAHARRQGRGGHIPEERFHAQFGRSHHFHAQRPVIVEGQPRFEYGGYSFVLIDAWPGDWAYTDDCYIDYVDGDYFLFDLLHPGERIALFVVM